MNNQNIDEDPNTEAQIIEIYNWYYIIPILLIFLLAVGIIFLIRRYTSSPSKLFEPSRPTDIEMRNLITSSKTEQIFPELHEYRRPPNFFEL